MKFAIRFFLIMLLATMSSAIISATELPADLLRDATPGIEDVLDSDSDQMEHRMLDIDPVAMFANMYNDRKNNATLLIRLAPHSPLLAKELARVVEETWNIGDFDTALDYLEKMNGRGELNEAVFHVSWRTPLTTDETTRFGNDVRIGNRDSIYINDLEIDYTTSNIFAVLLFEGDEATSSFTINISSDGGDTWTESGRTWTSGYEWKDVDAAIIAEHLYVGYEHAGQSIQLQRFSTDEGWLDSFPDGEYWETGIENDVDGDSIVELSIVSNQDFPGASPKLYLTTLSRDGDMKWAWSTDATSWTEKAYNISSADRGLSTSLNLNYGTYWQFASYFDKSNNVVIDGFNGSTWTNVRVIYGTSASPDYTSISAYQDTVHCFYDYRGTLMHHQYHVSYNGGTSWYYGVVDDTTVISESAAVCARRGGGVGVIYRYYTPTRTGRFSWRDYSGAWSDYEIFTDNEPYYNQPSIQYIGEDRFGILYLSWSNPHIHAAYFDNGPTCCSDPIRGNVNGDAGDEVNIRDLTYLVAYLFGPPETLVPCAAEANVNGDSGYLINIADLTYLIGYMFGGGPDPAPCP